MLPAPGSAKRDLRNDMSIGSWRHNEQERFKRR